MDAADLDDEASVRFKNRCSELGREVVYVSAVTGDGLDELVKLAAEKLRDLPPITVYDTEFTYCYALNNTVYAMDSYGFNIIDDTYFKSYDLSDTSIDLYNSMAFELDGKIFVLEAPGETKVNLYTLADKSDRFTYMGDVDNDEWVTSSDALMALQYSTGVKPLTSAQCRRADVTGDDKINSSDALLMLKYSTGLVPQP